MRLELLESNGFTLTGELFNLFSVCYRNKKILYLRKNENNTFQTIEFLNYPSSFPKLMNNVTEERVVEILRSVIRNNHGRLEV